MRIYSLYFIQATLSPRGFFFHLLFLSFPLLNTITNIISCAVGGLISPPHNDSGPHDTFHLLSHTIKARKISWQLLTNHRDKLDLEMFFLRGILHPAGLLVIVISVFVSVMHVWKKYFNSSPVRGLSWILSMLECLLMACHPFFISDTCEVPLS